MRLPKYSMGIGDRFAHEGPAQLDALIRAAAHGVAIAPVWNKSHREHAIVGSSPGQVRAEADAACKARGWTGPWFVDADHVGLKTVDAFVDACDYFTLDVADFIGRPAAPDDLAQLVATCRRYVGRIRAPGLDRPLEITEPMIVETGRKYLEAAGEAGRIYRHLAEAKAGEFVTEVSMDETDRPQTPVELFIILAALAGRRIPVQTIAPRLSGRFNKGVDYAGDVEQFAREFDEHVAVVALAREEFGLPDNLKLSVHSGSDKFAIYGPMRRVLRKHDAGIHLKTAGTTWLEELIGLAQAGGDGLDLAKEIAVQALARCDELVVPYASVVDIDRRALPTAETVRAWDGPALAAAMRHVPGSAAYNPSFRQVLHVAYKVAAELGPRFIAALEKHADPIARNVTENLYQRHIRPLFL
jgi:hypothetical protein